MISGNRAFGLGGAYYGNSNIKDVRSLHVNNNIASNYSSSGGGAFHGLDFGGDLKLRLINTVVWGNSSQVEGDYTSFDRSYSLIQDSLPSGPGDLDGTDPANDPRFLNPQPSVASPTCDGNYKVDDCSPLIDAGSVDSVLLLSDLCDSN